MKFFPESRMVLFISCPNVLKILTGTSFSVLFWISIPNLETKTKRESSLYSFMEFGEVINEIIFELAIIVYRTKKYSSI